MKRGKLIEYEKDAIYVPCPSPCTADEFLRQHDVWKRTRDGSTKGLTYDMIKADICDALARLHYMRPLAQEDSRIADAMRDTCRRIRASSDTLNMCETYGLTPDDYALHDASPLDVSCYPPRVTFDYSPTRMPDSEWIVCATPVTRTSHVQFSAVSPHQQTCLSCDAICGNMAVFVFRAPNSMLTRLEDGTILGFSRESASLYVSDTYEYLQEMAFRVTLGFGATWVWVHAKSDHFQIGPRTLRDKGCATIVLDRGHTLVLRRGPDFGWHFSLVKDK